MILVTDRDVVVATWLIEIVDDCVGKRLRCQCSQFSLFYPLHQSLLMALYNLQYFGADCDLFLGLIVHHLVQCVRSCLFYAIGQSNLNLSLLLFQLQELWFWLYFFIGTRFTIFLCYLRAQLRLVSWCGSCPIFLAHDILVIQCLHNSGPAHQSHHSFLEESLTIVQKWVHFFHSFLLYRQKYHIKLKKLRNIFTGDIGGSLKPNFTFKQVPCIVHIVE